MSAYDVIVIGAGHNGLALAALLAKRGRRVLVLERRDIVGGLCAGGEFHPGYTSPGVLYDTSGVRPAVVRALELEKHGLRWRDTPADVVALGKPGQVLHLYGDVSRTAEELSAHAPQDAANYVTYRSFLERVSPGLRLFLEEPLVDVTATENLGAWDLLRRGLRMRKLQKSDIIELLRVPPMCVADWLSEWFALDLLKTALALPAVIGAYAGPWSPGTSANLLFLEAAAGPGVVGNGPMLVAALQQACLAHGVEIRGQARVDKLLVEARRVTGVVLDNGERVLGSSVAASCDPQTLFLKLMPAGSCSSKLLQRARTYRCRGTTAQILFAANAPPRFGGDGSPVEFARLGAHLDDMERAFDAVKYGRLPEEPVLDIHVPTLANPQLAPKGKAIVSVLVHFAPYDLRTGWNDASRDRLASGVTRMLEAHAPGFAESILAQAVLSPVDIEREYGVAGGHVFHGEHAIDQRLIRPVAECTSYKTPIEGLYLCGSGAHPGGGLSCAPGFMAAQALLAD